MNRQSLDLRDVIKDSMYREARGVSHKSTTKDKALDHVVNYRESVVVSKLREANWYIDEPRVFSKSKSYHFRDGFSFSAPKDCPRFSYDGKETNRLSFESRYTPKQLKEMPRFPLDDSESYFHSLKSVPPIPNKASANLRPPSLVAKLMGLETLPDSALASDQNTQVGAIRTRAVEDVDSLSKSSNTTDLFGPKIPISARSSTREPTSPCWKNHDMKPVSRFPIEPAPWKQRDGAQSQQNPASRVVKTPSKTHSPFYSIYSDIDKRLKYLEFAQSGKDLRAHKQILEAMGNHQNPKFTKTGPSIYESPIVVMKPAKLVERSNRGASSTISDGFSVEKINESIRKEHTLNFPDAKTRGRQRRATQTSRQRQLTKESITNSEKKSRSVSPRLQQKSLESERRSSPPTPSTDSSKPRKQSNKEKPESSSLRRRAKDSNFCQNKERSSEISRESRKLSYGETQMPRQHNLEVTASECSEETDSRKSSNSFQEKSLLPLREDESLGVEYASPVSVLDDALCMDNSPSPVKHNDATQSPSKESVKDQPEVANDVTPNTINSRVTFEINREKLKNIEKLVQKLKRLNSSNDDAHTDCIPLLSKNTTPDHRYISQIFLASGLLLRDLGSNLTTFQFHPSGHPINPDLFLVLEQTKFKNLDTPEDLPTKKLHRKLIFDTINEILVGKLAFLVPSIETWSRRPCRLTMKAQNAQKLLRELSSEIEQLQVQKKSEEDDDLKHILWEAVLDCTGSWTDFDVEVPVIALEIERLIFKELVKEVVIDDAS